MKADPLIVVVISTCCICRYTSVEIKLELKKNSLQFSFGINYKYEGMLTHSFDRFCVVTKFILPTIQDLKLSTLKFDDKCEHLQEKKGQNSKTKECILTYNML